MFQIIVFLRCAFGVDPVQYKGEVLHGERAIRVQNWFQLVAKIIIEGSGGVLVAEKRCEPQHYRGVLPRG